MDIVKDIEYRLLKIEYFLKVTFTGFCEKYYRVMVGKLFSTKLRSI